MVGARPVSVFSKSRSTDSPVCKHGRQKKDVKQDLLYNAAKEEQLKILQVNLVVLMLVSPGMRESKLVIKQGYKHFQCMESVIMGYLNKFRNCRCITSTRIDMLCYEMGIIADLTQ